jgi:hypothetical protein
MLKPLNLKLPHRSSSTCVFRRRYAALLPPSYPADLSAVDHRELRKVAQLCAILTPPREKFFDSPVATPAPPPPERYWEQAYRDITLNYASFLPL